MIAPFDGRGVARDIFLDRNTFRDSHPATKQHVVTDAAVGVASNFRTYKPACISVLHRHDFGAGGRAKA
ncbi:MAG: lipid A-modifier LpxR family protein [Casimicrobium sp.]